MCYRCCEWQGTWNGIFQNQRREWWSHCECLFNIKYLVYTVTAWYHGAIRQTCSVSQSCLTLCSLQASLSMGFSRQGYWSCPSSSRGSSRPRDWICIFCIAGGFSTIEPPGKPIALIKNALKIRTVDVVAVGTGVVTRPPSLPLLSAVSGSW